MISAYHSNVLVNGEDSFVRGWLVKLGRDKLLDTEHHTVLTTYGYCSAAAKTANTFTSGSLKAGFHVRIFRQGGICGQRGCVPSLQCEARRPTLIHVYQALMYILDLRLSF